MPLIKPLIFCLEGFQGSIILQHDEKMEKDRKEILVFYEFTSEHLYWASIRITKPIKSAFVTVRLRKLKRKNYSSRKTTLSIITV
ncbi:MAG: hypothetical protein ACTS73_00480 [Arsenophonus sp. NEOnobi-MAG3]